MQEQTFQLLLNGIPYVVKATPFDFNGERRYSVSYNGSEEYIFAYDLSAKQYVSIGDETETMPSDVEVAIAQQLYILK